MNLWPFKKEKGDVITQRLLLKKAYRLKKSINGGAADTVARYHGLIAHDETGDQFDILLVTKLERKEIRIPTSRESFERDFEAYLQEHDNFEFSGSDFMIKTFTGKTKKNLKHSIQSAIQVDDVYFVRTAAPKNSPDLIYALNDQLETLWTLAPKPTAGRDVGWMDIDWDKGKLWVCDTMGFDWPVDIRTGQISGYPCWEYCPRE